MRTPSSAETAADPKAPNIGMGFATPLASGDNSSSLSVAEDSSGRPRQIEASAEFRQ